MHYIFDIVRPTGAGFAKLHMGLVVLD